MGRLFSENHITQKYIKRYPNSKRTKSWEGKLVHIQTENGVWRTDGAGYTYTDRDDAWILPFEDAVRQISHCGPEKRGMFLLAAHPKQTGGMISSDGSANTGLFVAMEAWSNSFKIDYSDEYRQEKRDIAAADLLVKIRRFLKDKGAR